MQFDQSIELNSFRRLIDRLGNVDINNKFTLLAMRWSVRSAAYVLPIYLEEDKDNCFPVMFYSVFR